MDYGDMLDQIQRGRKFKRSGWDGRDQYIFIMPAHALQQAVSEHMQSADEVVDQIWIKTSGGKLGPYTASTCDTLANDWGFFQTQEELNAPKPFFSNTQTG